MRKLFYTAVITCFTSFAATAQCDVYIPMVKGYSYEMTIYNGKDKITGTATYTVNDVKNEGKQADMTNEVKNEKGKATSTTTYTITCNDGNLNVDLKSLVPAQTLEGYKDMDIKAKGDAYIVVPQNLGVGQVLPDATGIWEITAKGSATVMTTLSLTVTNRKVDGKESITTTAGTFDCFKVIGDTKMVTSTFGLEVPFEYKTEEYFCPGTGIIKSAAYRNDKLQGYNLISKITK